METISSKIEAMKIFTEFGLTRLKWDLRKVDDEVLNWRIAPESNSVKWLLRHISMILNVYIPRAFTSNLTYLPTSWSKSYQEDTERSLAMILEDIEYGKNLSLKGFHDLTKESLEEHIDWYIGDEKRETYLMILVSEILHHEGQIAAIIGLKNRIDGNPAKPIPPEA